MSETSLTTFMTSPQVLPAEDVQRDIQAGRMLAHFAENTDIPKTYQEAEELVTKKYQIPLMLGAVVDIFGTKTSYGLPFAPARLSEFADISFEDEKYQVIGHLASWEMERTSVLRLEATKKVPARVALGKKPSVILAELHPLQPHMNFTVANGQKVEPYVFSALHRASMSGLHSLYDAYTSPEGVTMSIGDFLEGSRAAEPEKIPLYVETLRDFASIMLHVRDSIVHQRRERLFREQPALPAEGGRTRTR